MMPRRKGDGTDEAARAAQRKRRLADLGEDAVWKKKRAAREERVERKDAKAKRDER